MKKLLVMSALACSLASAQSLPITNFNFSNVPVQCTTGYAYQSAFGGTCADPLGPEQRFNSSFGAGWQFTPQFTASSGTGITGPGTNFNPPSFDGLPFDHAAFLQNANSAVAQTIYGFVSGQTYQLSFYLGSRYVNAGNLNGNQIVQALIDDRIIGTWGVLSYSPFTIRTAYFSVITGGPHRLKLVGRALGDHTAFFSGVSVIATRANAPDISQE